MGKLTTVGICQEVAADSLYRQVGIVLDGACVTPAVLHGDFLDRLSSAPIAAVPVQGNIFVELILAAVSEAKHRSRSQGIAAAFCKGCVKVKGQNHGAVCICHRDPAHVLIAALSQLTAVGIGQEVAADGLYRQVGVVLDGVCVTPAVLHGHGRLCSRHSPAGAVKGEGVVFVQCVLAVVGKAEDRALGQGVGLTGFKSAVEMEGQHDGAACIVHSDPSRLLIPVCTLIDGASIIGGGEVCQRCICGQVGVDLNQVARAVAILQAQSAGAVFCHAGKDLCRVKIVLCGYQQIL